MFGNVAVGAASTAKVVNVKDVPEATPVTIPRYQPFAQHDGVVDTGTSLPSLLRHTGRSDTSILGVKGLSALGTNLTLDATTDQLVPDPSFIPDFSGWDQLSPEEAQTRHQSTRCQLRNGNLSPGCQTYQERIKELSHSNEEAFRTVRRIPPPKGQQHARLGNAYEFFRCLEMFTSFWDDTSNPPELPPSPEATQSVPAGTADSRTVRTAEGTAMPTDYRQKLTTAFLKMVCYDFGCNVAFARTEPRLHLSTPEGTESPRKSYLVSTCSFIFQSPKTREASRAGLVYGPVAAVSARVTTNFTTPDMETAQALDLSKEICAALITAQHRAREGKEEVRFGEGQWWTQKPRWGGGAGGPIGREIEREAKEDAARPNDPDGLPLAKKPRKNMIMYDKYRMVRPPAYTWDKKARYEAIGKVPGSTFDDVFVVSCLFHHISILRVRVPLRLLDVLEGAPEQDPAVRSWGNVQAWRSPWYDMFETEGRIEAMKTFWAVMAYQMRECAVDQDVAMKDADIPQPPDDRQ
ncbi:uncharacterized protein F5Z01DRAFT_640541 [Emericellopsis atlantica]|uniref:Uncharacterized protein n=1 Tax=Emericellopsis atlantica TaxID=2614577 RepID=A0A9P7ZEP4_9HYPO|nr:uncharacterized protein F5Z01DRAFT_640541 [Emericellopsis atlantica]KAG9250175.1 hypothetical protein F5Z01DRAFT_640541 [Emericellopsis atlantica]